MRTKRELMREILETAVIESVKQDCEVVYYDVEVDEEMHRLQVITGQFVVKFYHLEDEDSDYSSSCPHLVCTFSPWEIEEALDTFFMMDGETGELHVDESEIELGIDEEENYELEAKDDKEQSKLTLAVEEAKKEAKIEVLTKLKARYVNLYNQYIGGESSNAYDLGGALACNACIISIENMLEDLK